jgi:CheY-like chemotaxis protein
MNVWLIDDDNVTNMLNRFFLEEHFTHLNITAFVYAQDAFNTLMQTSQKPDVIFLDINMPVMNGWEFLDALGKNITSMVNIPQIYLLSSSLDPSDKGKAAHINLVKGFISKPLEIEKIGFLYPA